LGSNTVPEALAAYKQISQPPRNNKRLAPPENPFTLGGYRSPNITISIIPIQPYLDTIATNAYELTKNHSKHSHTNLHKIDGTSICTI
jgi:hypothetical protein